MRDLAKRLGPLIIIMVVLLSLASGLSVTSAQGIEQWSRTTWVLLPAVEGTSGVVTNATVTLSYPGSGQVVVTDNTGPAGSSTLDSMRMAFMVAMTYAGLNWQFYNLNVHINVSGQISGPSGSFGVMLAVYSLATGVDDSYLHRFAVTGAVSPSGLSGPIGGLQYKCEAASADGLGIAYPVGNLVNSSLECNNSLQVPLAGIAQALHELLNAYPFSLNVSVSQLPGFSSVMSSVAQGFISNSTRIIEGLSSANVADQAVAQEVDTYVNSSLQDLQLARKYLSSIPYAAASYAFTAYIYALAANYTEWAYEYYKRGLSVSSFFTSEASKISGYATSMISSDANLTNSTYTLAFAELMATAFARLADSLYYASYASSIAGQVGNNVSEAYVPAYYLAVAYARLASAEGWVEAARESGPSGPSVSSLFISTTAEAAGKFTDAAIQYADSLINYYVQEFESVGDVAEAQVLQSMESDLNFLVSEGDQLLSNGYYLAAIGVYEDALTNALNIIFVETQSFTVPQVIGSYAKELELEYSMLASSLAKRGLGSSLDASYMSYAGTLMSSDPQDAIYIMETAVIDELVWYLGSLAYSSSYPVSPIVSAAPSLAGLIAVVLAAVAVGATGAAAFGLWYYKRHLASLGP